MVSYRCLLAVSVVSNEFHVCGLGLSPDCVFLQADFNKLHHAIFTLPQASNSWLPIMSQPHKNRQDGVYGLKTYHERSD